MPKKEKRTQRSQALEFGPSILDVTQPTFGASVPSNQEAGRSTASIRLGPGEAAVENDDILGGIIMGAATLGTDIAKYKTNEQVELRRRADAEYQDVLKVRREKAHARSMTNQAWADEHKKVQLKAEEFGLGWQKMLDATDYYNRDVHDRAKILEDYFSVINNDETNFAIGFDDIHSNVYGMYIKEKAANMQVSGAQFVSTVQMAVNKAVREDRGFVDIEALVRNYRNGYTRAGNTLSPANEAALDQIGDKLATETFRKFVVDQQKEANATMDDIQELQSTWIYDNHEYDKSPEDYRDFVDEYTALAITAFNEENQTQFAGLHSELQSDLAERIKNLARTKYAEEHAVYKERQKDNIDAHELDSFNNVHRVNTRHWAEGTKVVDMVDEQSGYIHATNSVLDLDIENDVPNLAVAYDDRLEKWAMALGTSYHRDFVADQTQLNDMLDQLFLSPVLREGHYEGIQKISLASGEEADKFELEARSLDKLDNLKMKVKEMLGRGYSQRHNAKVQAHSSHRNGRSNSNGPLEWLWHDTNMLLSAPNIDDLPYMAMTNAIAHAVETGGDPAAAAAEANLTAEEYSDKDTQARIRTEFAMLLRNTHGIDAGGTFSPFSEGDHKYRRVVEVMVGSETNNTNPNRRALSNGYSAKMVEYQDSVLNQLPMLMDNPATHAQAKNGFDHLYRMFEAGGLPALEMRMRSFRGSDSPHSKRTQALMAIIYQKVKENIKTPGEGVLSTSAANNEIEDIRRVLLLADQGVTESLVLDAMAANFRNVHPESTKHAEEVLHDDRDKISWGLQKLRPELWKQIELQFAQTFAQMFGKDVLEEQFGMDFDDIMEGDEHDIEVFNKWFSRGDVFRDPLVTEYLNSVVYEVLENGGVLGQAVKLGIAELGGKMMGGYQLVYDAGLGAEFEGVVADDIKDVASNVHIIPKRRTFRAIPGPDGRPIIDHAAGKVEAGLDMPNTSSSPSTIMALAKNQQGAKVPEGEIGAWEIQRIGRTRTSRPVIGNGEDGGVPIDLSGISNPFMIALRTVWAERRASDQDSYKDLDRVTLAVLWANTYREELGFNGVEEIEGVIRDLIGPNGYEAKKDGKNIGRFKIPPQITKRMIPYKGHQREWDSVESDGIIPMQWQTHVNLSLTGVETQDAFLDMPANLGYVPYDTSYGQAEAPSLMGAVLAGGFDPVSISAQIRARDDIRNQTYSPMMNRVLRPTVENPTTSQMLGGLGMTIKMVTPTWIRNNANVQKAIDGIKDIPPAIASIPDNFHFKGVGEGLANVPGAVGDSAWSLGLERIVDQSKDLYHTLTPEKIQRGLANSDQFPAFVIDGAREELKHIPVAVTGYTPAALKDRVDLMWNHLVRAKGMSEEAIATGVVAMIPTLHKFAEAAELTYTTRKDLEMSRVQFMALTMAQSISLLVESLGDNVLRPIAEGFISLYTDLTEEVK